ncbi:MAG: hypothetical protein IJX89_00580 [Alphaproteobacteria bacterium]|nr:hypothetical protein [Alphaproteobacteria bacterium]
MKKIAFLTSVLALAACGGSGGGSAPAMLEKPVVPNSSFVDTVATSNSEITGMVSNSEYQVARYVAHKLGDYAADVNLSRVATTRGAFVPKTPTGDTEYDTARELIDLAAWLVEDTTSESDIVEMFNKSKLDKNKIKSALKLMDDMYCFVGGDATETARRIKESNFEKTLADLQQRTEIMTLDGVDLYTSQMQRIKFNVDKNGKIVSYEYPDYLVHNDDGSVSFTRYDDDGSPEYPVDDDTDGVIVRRDNTNIFVQASMIPLSQMNDEDPDANIVSTENITDASGSINLELYDEYISYGKQLGLKYADFGIMKNDFKNATFATTGLNDAGKQEVREFLDAWGVMITPFAGGYASKKISNEDMKTLANDGSITFTGTAFADVRYRDGLAYNGNGIDVPLTDDMMTDTNATLVFDNTGTQTLTADFSDNWYKIQAVQSADGTNKLVVFGDRNGDGKTNDNDRVTKTFDVDGDGSLRTYDFTLVTSASGLTSDNNVVPEFDNQGNLISKDSETMAFTAGYYGDNNTPTEATATMRYSLDNSSDWEWVNDNGNWRPNDNGGDGNINVELGFGGTR